VFEAGSRYAAIETARITVVGPDGEESPVTYVRRRVVPPPAGGAPLATHRVAVGDRLDLLAARYLGDPELFWRICDANAAHRPDELVEEPGRLLRIAMPEGV
jgi:hypothetical protein